MSELILQNVTTPATPAAGYSTAYVDSSDKRVKAILDDAAIHVLSPSKVGVNQLMNGGFWFAQRQTPGTLTTYSNTSGRTYAADRWGMTNENASIQYQRVDTIVPETALQARYYGRFKKITSAGKMIVSQVVEGVNVLPLRGRTVRFQVKMRFSVAASMTVRLGLLQLTSAGTIDTIPATFASAFGIAGTDPTWGTNLTALTPTQPDGGSVSGLGLTCVLTSGWVRYSASFAVPANCLNLVAVIWTNGLPAANDELNISEAGLYDGYEIMDWSPSLVQQELERCQRYYSKTFPIDLAPAQSAGVDTGEFKFIAGLAGSGTPSGERSPSYRQTVTMRTTPTNTGFNPAAANAQVRDETAGADCTATAFAGSSDSSVGVTATGNAATAVGGLLGIHITSDAEL